MSKYEHFMAELPEDKRVILHHCMCFPDYFSVDWLPVSQPSNLMSLINLLMKQKWLLPKEREEGCYIWSDTFPRLQIISMMPPAEMQQLYRQNVNMLLNKISPFPKNNGIILTIARQCLLAGIQEGDLDFVLKAASMEEARHHLTSAIALYDAILEFIDKLINRQDQLLLDSTWYTFIRAIERRSSLSLFHPSLKKVNRFLLSAIATARRLKDIKSQASLELMIGQSHWMHFRHKEAVRHFDAGWRIIKQINDDELHKWGSKTQGLAFTIKSQFRKAIDAYEQSLGDLESDNENDFFHLVSLSMALIYTEIGMPQRGLGIAENIQHYCQKNKNMPLLALDLLMTGMIFVEIAHLDKSRDYFEKALEIAVRENLPMVEVMVGMGISFIEFKKGNFNRAGEYFKALWKIKKSSWYHILNFPPVFDTPFLLHSAGVSPIDLKPLFTFLHSLPENEVNPLMYGRIQRLQFTLSESRVSPAEKTKILTALETKIKRLGNTFELAKLRIDLARVFDQEGDVRRAENYAQKAWEFYKPIAKDCFPQELRHLISGNKSAKQEPFFELIVDLGKALMAKENIESLLSKIIASISKTMGSERIAIFIRSDQNKGLKMIASRNLPEEKINEDAFEKTLALMQGIFQSHDGKIIENKTTLSSSADSRQIILMPLKLDNTVIGILYQDSRFFSLEMTPDNIDFLSAFASQIAVSIDRAQAYDEIAQLNRKLLKENLYYIEEKEEFRPFGEIIGSSKPINALHSLIKKVASTQSTVLIHGETGVGKELVARAIHRASMRREGPFIRVNCASLPDTLIDSELFGYEKGAFTGAMKMKEGRFELAHNGTIFLDEVSELPLQTQSRLLRILQEKEFQRVGGTKTLYSDFRLITATNKDLSQEVAAGRFRADLFYRLNVFPIYVPALRERAEDIPLLATHFLKLHCSQSNKQYLSIPEAEMQRLISYSWPGNIRELSNMIERAVIIGGPEIRFSHLEQKRKGHLEIHREMKLKDMEKAKILEALEQAGGKIGGINGAAEKLGLKRTTLIQRMKKLKINIARHQIIHDMSS
jgi:transcriptional regulator with GAF, ATPase, and Fis domain